MKSVVVIAHDIRSAHNIGALLRLCDGLGVNKLYLSGHSPYPEQRNDQRLPHESKRTTAQIHKTALGAERSIPWEHRKDITTVIGSLRNQGYSIAAIEQSDKAVSILDFEAPRKIAIILGNEVIGLDDGILSQATDVLEIPMMGKKESHNVVSAAAIVLSRLCFDDL